MQDQELKWNITGRKTLLHTPVFDVTEQTVYWCERQDWDNIEKKVLKV